jgi:hypothetical protein
MATVFFRIWTLPNTLLGLALGYLGVLFGGQVQRVRGCWEFHGSLVRWILQQMPTGSGAMAMTLGHTILGQDKSSLEIARDHEHVHVRQYERWGPCFIPAYLFASAIVWLRGGNAYLDNVFEVEAFNKTGLSSDDCLGKPRL